MAASLSPPSIQVSAARVVYGGAPLFDGLDLSLAAGRWTCLLGPSGVGKSTLLRLIAGLVPASAPTRLACDDGRPLAGRLAYMAQQDLLLPWLDVLGNVLLGHRLRGEPPPRDKALHLLHRVGLGEAVHARPAELSGGMRQRVALVRTLVEDRPVVLMDEPFSALDAITRLRLQTLAAGMLTRHTVLLVTHDPLEALRLGHEVLVMAGRPAQLRPVAVPEAPPPRAADDAQVLAAQARLLTRLQDAWSAA